MAAAVSRVPYCCLNVLPGETDIAQIKNLFASKRLIEKVVSKLITELPKKEDLSPERIQKEIAQAQAEPQEMCSEEGMPLQEARETLSKYKGSLVTRIANILNDQILKLTSNDTVWSKPSFLSMRIWFDGHPQLRAFQDVHRLAELNRETVEKATPVIALYASIEAPTELQASCEKVKAVALEQLVKALDNYVPPSEIVVEWQLESERFCWRSIETDAPLAGRSSHRTLGTPNPAYPAVYQA